MDDACATAFARLKVVLTEAPVLAYPDAGRPFVIDTDASNVGVGAVLTQGVGEEERAVAHFSRTLSRAERIYCVTRQELLVVVLAGRHFRLYLHGKHFLIRTDHASLTWLLSFKNPEGQVARWLEVLQEYDFEIQHWAGRLHSNTNALSRRPCAVLECRYCLRQEERANKSPMVAALQTSKAAQTISEAEGWLPLSARQLKLQQWADDTLTRVTDCLEAGQCPSWPEVSARGPEVKAYQWRLVEFI